MEKTMLFIALFFGLLLTGAEKVLIWELTAPGLPGKAYLAGSIHVGKKEWYPLDSVYDHVLKESSAVWFEIYKPDPSEAAQLLLQHGMYTNGKTLSNVLNYEDFQKLTAFFQKNAPYMSADMLLMFRPWTLWLEIAQIYLRQHPEYTVLYGLEYVITANMKNQTGHSLESARSQIGQISGIPDTASARILMEGIADFSNAGKELQRISEALKSGNMTALTEQCDELAIRHPEFYRQMFEIRNETMAVKIYELLKKKQVVFVLIGAAHFTGKGSIPGFLLQKGCSIRQLNKTMRKGSIQLPEK